MTIMYKAIFDEIEQHEVAKVTAKSVTLASGRRELIESEYHIWAHTYDEAAQAMAARAANKAELCEAQAAQYREKEKAALALVGTNKCRVR